MILFLSIAVVILAAWCVGLTLEKEQLWSRVESHEQRIVDIAGQFVIRDPKTGAKLETLATRHERQYGKNQGVEPELAASAPVSTHVGPGGWNKMRRQLERQFAVRKTN